MMQMHTARREGGKALGKGMALVIETVDATGERKGIRRETSA